MVGQALALVDLAVSAQVGDDGEIPPTAVYFAGER